MSIQFVSNQHLSYRLAICNSKTLHTLHDNENNYAVGCDIMISRRKLS